MELLQAVGLTRRFGQRTAVDGIGFSARRGEVIGFLGPNGAGKTTTFQLLAGLLAPHAGEVQLDGRVVALHSRELRSRMGIVFQNPSLDPQLTGRENLELGAALYAVPASIARERVAWALTFSGLADRQDDLVRHYSGGMRRRLELARVMLHRPEIVLLDEPTQGIDLAASRRLWHGLLEQRRREGLTVLLTTHSAEEAEQCDRIILLDQGKMLADGSPDELRARIGGDVVWLSGDDAETLAAEVSSAFDVEARLVEGQVVFEHPSASTLLPKLFAAFPGDRIRGITTRRPSLADVFLKLTGQTIEGADATATAAPELPRSRRSS